MHVPLFKPLRNSMSCSQLRRVQAHEKFLPILKYSLKGVYGNHVTLGTGISHVSSCMQIDFSISLIYQLNTHMTTNKLKYFFLVSGGLLYSSCNILESHITDLPISILYLEALILIIRKHKVYDIAFDSIGIQSLTVVLAVT